MPPFNLDAFLPYQLNVLAGRLSRDFAALYHRAYGITIPEWRVVAHLAAEGAVSVREIHRKVDMDKSRVSRAASRLEEAGYVTKTRNPQDLRLIELRLTKKGRAMIDDLAPQAHAFETRVMARLGPEADAFRAALRRLLDT
jgi:DNA-binding MarR family transcriptional regulator